MVRTRYSVLRGLDTAKTECGNGRKQSYETLVACSPFLWTTIRACRELKAASFLSLLTSEALILWFRSRSFLPQLSNLKLLLFYVTDTVNNAKL